MKNNVAAQRPKTAIKIPYEKFICRLWTCILRSDESMFCLIHDDVINKKCKNQLPFRVWWYMVLMVTCLCVKTYAEAYIIIWVRVRVRVRFIYQLTSIFLRLSMFCPEGPFKTSPCVTSNITASQTQCV